MTEYVPVAVLVGTVTVNAAVPEADNGFLSKLVVQPLGTTGVERVTGLLSPFRNVTAIFVVPAVPALMVIGLGDAEIVKSGVV